MRGAPFCLRTRAAWSAAPRSCHRRRLSPRSRCLRQGRRPAPADEEPWLSLRRQPPRSQVLIRHAPAPPSCLPCLLRAAARGRTADEPGARTRMRPECATPDPAPRFRSERGQRACASALQTRRRSRPPQQRCMRCVCAQCRVPTRPSLRSRRPPCPCPLRRAPSRLAITGLAEGRLQPVPVPARMLVVAVTPSAAPPPQLRPRQPRLGRRGRLWLPSPPPARDLCPGDGPRAATQTRKPPRRRCCRCGMTGR